MGFYGASAVRTIKCAVFFWESYGTPPVCNVDMLAPVVASLGADENAANSGI